MGVFLNSEGTYKVQLRILHVGSWFSVGELTSAVKYGLGGRRGRKVGATRLNGAYDIPLAIPNSTLRTDALTLKRVGNSLWMSPSGTSDECVTVLDSAFIDDEFIASLAPWAEQLAARIPVMLDRLVNVFADFGDCTSTGKLGNTECMIRLRGRWSSIVFKKLCCIHESRDRHESQRSGQHLEIFAAAAAHGCGLQTEYG